MAAASPYNGPTETLDKEPQMRRFVLPFVLLALAAAVSASAFAARESTGPVVKWKSASFGQILATPGHLALYTWNQEKA